MTDGLYTCRHCGAKVTIGRQCPCSTVGKVITRAEALRISRETMERAEQKRDCHAAGDGGTHWLSGCQCQEKRHELLEAEHRAIMAMSANADQRHAAYDRADHPEYFRLAEEYHMLVDDWLAAVKAVEDTR